MFLPMALSLRHTQNCPYNMMVQGISTLTVGVDNHCLQVEHRQMRHEVCHPQPSALEGYYQESLHPSWDGGMSIACDSSESYSQPFPALGLPRPQNII